MFFVRFLVRHASYAEGVELHSPAIRVAAQRRTLGADGQRRPSPKGFHHELRPFVPIPADHPGAENMTRSNRDATRTARRSSRRPRGGRAAGATAVSALAALAVPRVHAASDETLKVALIGCGGRGTGAAAQALKTSGPVVLWAMADLFADQIESSLASLRQGGQRYDRDRDEGFAGKINVPPERRFAGFDAYRRAIDSGVDVALLTTFPHFRPEHYEYAVQRGVHVFQEKPLAVDAPGVRRIPGCG